MKERSAGTRDLTRVRRLTIMNRHHRKAHILRLRQSLFFFTYMSYYVERKQEIMLYNVAQLMKARVGTSLENDIHEEDIQLDEDIEIVSQIDVHVHIRSTNQSLLVNGRVYLKLGI